MIRGYVLIGLLLGVLFSTKAVSQTVKKPNFIIIYTDDQRFDGLGIFKNQIIKTPHLDRFLSQGLLFNKASVVFSLCSPSRAALLTGRYGSANGVLELEIGLNADEITAAQYLKDNGYITALSGKWHLTEKPEEVGFDFFSYFFSNGPYYHREINTNGVIEKPAIHCDVYCANQSVEFIKTAAKSESPFFLFHNTQLPHMNHELEWDAKASTLDLYDEKEIQVPKNRHDNLSTKPPYLADVRNRTQAAAYGYPNKEAIQRHTKSYYAVITEMDEALAPIINVIDELDLLESTYVFFMSDNGWMLGEHGFTSKVLPYRPSTQVPLAILGPTVKKGNTDALALNIDLLPTILELAGVTIPNQVHGQSLVPFLLDPSGHHGRQAVVYEGLGSYGGTKPNLTVFDGRFRYIVTYEDATLENVNFSELYDNEHDPSELVNLIGSPIYQSTVDRLTIHIEKHKMEILN